MMRDVAHHFRAPGATIIAFQWAPHHDLLLAIAPVPAVEHHPTVPPRPHLTYLRFRHIHNRAEVDAFLQYLASSPTPHPALHTRSHGQRPMADGTMQQHIELDQPHTDVAVVIECDTADAVR